MIVLLVALAGCSSGGSRGEFGELQALLATCDQSAPPATWIGIDATGSSASEAIVNERMAAVEAVVKRTAVCSGFARIAVFTSSSAATTVLFEGSLTQAGATDNARLHRVPEAVAGVMEKVRATYGPAAASLTQDGSDIVGQLRLGGEWATQLAGSYRLHMVLLTDGFETAQVNLAARQYSPDEVRTLADQVAVPELAGASLTFAGLGRVVNGAPPSVIVEGLVTYYKRLCERTRAGGCIAVTDFAVEGR